MSKVYVSSTFADLRECRTKVMNAIRRMDHVDVAMEYDVAKDARPLDTCLAAVRQADIYLGIFALRYGFVPEGGDKSITELEYRAAREAGKECVILLLRSDASWPMDRIEFGAVERMQALRSELERSHTVSHFSGESDIEARVLEALHAWDRRRGVSRAPIGGWDGYREAVVKAHKWVRLSVIAGAQQDRIARIPLGEVFTPQLAVAGFPATDLPSEVLRYKEELFEHLDWPDRDGVSDGTPDGDDIDDGSADVLPSGVDGLADDLPELGLELLGRERMQVILGTPGSGKSTLLEYAALLLCEPEGEREPSMPHLAERPIPLIIDLRQYSLRRERPFLEYLATSVGERYGSVIDATALTRQLRDEPTLLLFDGLDEIFEPQARTWVVRQITALAEEFANASVVVTSRIVGYEPGDLFLAGFKHYTLIEFNAQQIDDFVRRWYTHYTWEGDERGADALIRRIGESPRLKELAGNPLLLTMMGVLFKHQDLPEQRWKLYERCTDVLLEDWDVKRKDIALKILLPLDITVRAPQKAEILQRVSMFMLEHSDARSELNAIAAEPLMRILADYLEEKYAKPPGEAAAIAQGILNHLRERTYILAEIGTKIFGFVHRTFMEYFAASQCTAEFNRLRADYDWLRELFRRNWDKEQWQEVLLLLTGMLADQRSPIRDIVEDLRRVSVPGPPFNLVFATRCLAEAGRADEEAAAADLVAALVDEVVGHALRAGSGGSSARFVEVGVTAFTQVAPLIAIGPRSVETIQQLSTASKARPRIVGWQMVLAIRPAGERLEFALAALEDDDEAVRRAAIAALHREWPGHPEVGRALVGVVRTDKLVRVRQPALDALQRNWPLMPEILDVIGERAASESAYTYVTYVIAYLERVWRLDPRVPDLIIQLARSFTPAYGAFGDEGAVLTAAAGALARTWGDDPAIFGRVIDLMPDYLWSSNRRAAMADILGVAWRSDAQALRALVNISASDRASSRRVAALEVLRAGWSGDPDIQREMARAARGDSAPSVRAAAILGVAGSCAESHEFMRVFEWLFEANGFSAVQRDDTSPSIPPPESAIELLRDVLQSDADPRVRCFGLFALLAVSSDPTARITTVLGHVAEEHDAQVRAMAAVLAAPTHSDRLGSEALDSATALLLAAADDANPRIAATAIRALTASRSTPSIVRVVEDKGLHSDRSVRAAVAGGWPVAPLRVLLRLLTEDEEPLVRAAAATSLIDAILRDGHDLGQCWEAVIRSAVEDADPLVRGQILLTLSGFPPAAAAPALRADFLGVAAEAIVARGHIHDGPAFLQVGSVSEMLWYTFDRLQPQPAGQVSALVHDRAERDPNEAIRTLAGTIERGAFVWFDWPEAGEARTGE